MTFEEAMQHQSAFCVASGAPITAAVCRAIARALDVTSTTGRRAIEWPGDRLADALPLRLVAPFHALYRASKVPSLTPLFEGRDTDGTAAVIDAVMLHDEYIAGWLDRPPQTNEPGRSATFMAALSVLSTRFGHPFELLEIGSSAGLNLLIDRFGFILGGAAFGPAAASVVIEPEWRGRPLDPADVRIASVRGVDIEPLDIGEADVAERLLSYVWVDAPERIARVRRAIGMMAERPVALARGDAAGWVEGCLRQPQADRTTRVLMHSVVWPYLPRFTQQRITTAVNAAGAAATADRPVAWVAFEHEDFSQPHGIRLRTWPGGEDVLLATAHPHGRWIDWAG